AGFSVALVPAWIEDISTTQSRVRRNFDHRPQVPTNLFSGVEEPLVFVGVEVPDDLIVRTEHPNFANGIGVEYALDITPIEERFKHTEILIDSCFAHLFHWSSLNFSIAAAVIRASGMSLPNSFSIALNEVSVCVRYERLWAWQYS